MAKKHRRVVKKKQQKLNIVDPYDKMDDMTEDAFARPLPKRAKKRRRVRKLSKKLTREEEAEKRTWVGPFV